MVCTWIFYLLFDSLHPIIDLSVIKGRVFLGWTSTKLGLTCLAQGHNTVTLVRLALAAPWSQVKHSTTEPLRSLPRNFTKFDQAIPFLQYSLSVS